MTRFIGSVLGFDYDIEFDTEQEFRSWLLAKLKRQQPEITNVIENMTAELKSKLAEIEARITALEAKRQ